MTHMGVEGGPGFRPPLFKMLHKNVHAWFKLHLTIMSKSFTLGFCVIDDMHTFCRCNILVSLICVCVISDVRMFDNGGFYSFTDSPITSSFHLWSKRRKAHLLHYFLQTSNLYVCPSLILLHTKSNMCTGLANLTWLVEDNALELGC